MSYVITEACIDVKDKACVEVCPVEAAEPALVVQDDIFVTGLEPQPRAPRADPKEALAVHAPHDAQVWVVAHALPPAGAGVELQRSVDDQDTVLARALADGPAVLEHRRLLKDLRS